MAQQLLFHPSATAPVLAGAVVPARPPADPRPGLPRFRLELIREPGIEYDAESLSGPASMARFVWRLVQHEPREVLGVIFLGSAARVIGYEIVYTGTLNRCSVEPRGILVPALLANAAAIVMFHNHPSGDASPSREDLLFTRRVHRAGEVLGVELLDHLIVSGPGNWISLRERGGW